MKHCPECNRNYADPTLSYCLNDGAPLIYGLAIEEPETAILSGDVPSEAPTRQIDPHTTTPTEAQPFPKLPTTARSRDHKSIWVLSALAIAIVLAALFGYRYLISTSAKQIESVAVLPFENGSGDPNLDYLSDGLSESLIDKLSELPQLKKVIARSSSFKYRGPNIDIQDVAQKLGVRAIVMGKVVRQADHLTIRVEMIDAQNGTQIWGEQYNRKASDLISIQQEIAQTASDKMRVKLTGQQEQQLVKHGTVNPQANDLLLLGRHFRDKPGTENVRKAIDYFEQAIAADPNYALAHAELSLKYSILTGGSAADPKVYMPKAEAEAHKALDLDDNLAEAHLAISRVYVARWQWQEGEAERKRAIQLDPNNALAHDLYAQLLALLGRFDESIAEARRALDLDPLSPITAGNLGYRLYFARRYDESIAELKKVRDLHPDSDFVYNMLGYDYSAKGQFKEAIDAYQQAIRLGDESTSIQVYLGAAYAYAGEREKALAILKQLQTTKEYVSPGELAGLYAALGDKEAAFASLNKAYDEHDLQLQFLKVTPDYDSLRDDPRYADLLTRVGLTAQESKNG
jgi:TolB-like protein/Tfp pilus assembly protein PilF